MTIFLVFVIMLMFSKYRNVRLGPDYSKPEYSFFAWIAMLFSAGMGIGLLFYGVAEPMLHYMAPPVGEGETLTAATQAMNYPFLHWGLHAWATYIIVGLSIAYFTYRKGFPLSIRSAFYPIFGEKIKGNIGHIIDIFAVLGTLFGVATSLGLGAMQINAGLSFLTGIETSTTIQILLIAGITTIATASVVSGVKRGIKWLSILNIIIGSFLLLFILITGPTVFILNSFTENIGYFVQNIIQTSLWNDAFAHTGWQSSWTLFYWAWWLSWAPYVGTFIAKISKGRTIKEFIAAVLFIPSSISFLWLTVFGGTGIFLYRNGTISLMNAVQENISIAIFEFLKSFPLTTFISGITVVALVSFFVTSSDSGSLVIDMITSGGCKNPPVRQKLFWAILEGVVAATLLLGGGLIALQTAALSLSLPFAIILLLMAYSLHKALKKEEPIID